MSRKGACYKYVGSPSPQVNVDFQELVWSLNLSGWLAQSTGQVPVYQELDPATTMIPECN